MIIQWIMANLEKVAMTAIVVPMVSAAGMIVFFALDDVFQDCKWYGKIMYGGLYEERDPEYVELYFGKAFVSLGVVNVLVPVIVIFSYLRITGKVFSDLWLTK